MSTATPYRLCPKCGSRRGVEEVLCANDFGGLPCSWDLTGEEIRDGADTAEPNARHDGHADGQAPAAPRCPNGHAVSPGDLLCPECNSELHAATPEESIAGWTVLGELPTAGSVRTRYRVRRDSDNREAVLTLYSPGAELDPTIYEALRTRVPRDHIPEVLEFGRWNGQAYEVAEEIFGGSLDTLNLDPADTPAIRILVEEVAKALASFMDVGLRHRALAPEKVLIRTREPLDIVIAGFESARLSDLDLDVESPLEVSRYTAPEAIMGGVSSASDWWGLGMILLELLTRGDCFAGVNDQLFLIHANANGVPIPAGLDPRLELLLQGLLTRDRTRRWQWKEVRAWLDGGNPPTAQDAPGSPGPETGPTISLGGTVYTDAHRFAIDASRAANWDEASDLLQHGEIARWAEELALDGRTVSALRDLGQRVEPAVGLRLGVALQLLNPRLPLILEETIVNPAWLLNNPTTGYELISGLIPELLAQYGLDTDHWLQRLARRASAIRARAGSLEITIDEEAFEVLALSTSRARLTAAWEARRTDFPDASHPSIASILDRTRYTDEDLILLLAASLDQFRSCDEIGQDIANLAARYGLPAPLPDDMRSQLARPRRELYALLEERMAGFARCGQERCDAWADQLRLERRLPIANLMLLLQVPPEQWTKPPHQEYVSSVLDFFEKRISGGILRGQLVRMTLAKTTPRIDLCELAADEESAATLLQNLLQHRDRTYPIDPAAFATPDGPERRMRSLLSRTLQYQRDTGINGAYIGFPFLLRRDRAAKSAPRLAPILLWPAKLIGEVGSRGNFTVAFDSEREVLLNPAFTGFFGLEGAREWAAIKDDLQRRSAGILGDIVDAFGVKAAPAGRSLQPLPRDLSGVTAGEEQCVCSAVLFHMEFMGQSLVEDLRQLKQRPPENSALEPMLRIGEADSAPEQRTGDEVSHVPIADRFLITHSDPSQEEAVIRARFAPGLLVQGPPGTGKSQTIVNLVADCIGHRRSVLIVCQKLPALEVVRKRLVAEGLESRLAMVTNIVKDRQPLLRAVREQIDALAGADASEARHYEREATRLAGQIDKLEARIDAQYHAAARVDEVSGKSYRQILGELIHLEEATDSQVVDAAGLRRFLAGHTDAAVADLEETCGAVAGSWLDAEYENSPLEYTLRFPPDDATLAEFHSAFDEFSSAEATRAALPARQTFSTPEPPSDHLEGWLGSHRSFLEGLSDLDLASVVPLLALFRDGAAGHHYTKLLESLLSLRRSHPSEPLAVPGLQDLLASADPAQSAAVAADCSRHANLWYAAHYEDSPLHILRASPGEADASHSIRKALHDLDDAEQKRLAIAGLHADAIQLGDPDGLPSWLEANGRRLIAASEEHLKAFPVLSGVFSPDRFGSPYIDILDRLHSLFVGQPPMIEAPAALRNLLGELDENAADRLADAMSRHASDWLEANLEDSPLNVLSASGDELRTHDEAFRRDFESLLAAEEARTDLGTPGSLALSLGDPGPLAAWLATHGDLFRSVSESRLEEIASRLSLFESPALVSAYIRLLQNSLANGPVPVIPEHLLAGLQDVVAKLSDAEITSVTDACTELAPLWLEADYQDSPLQVLFTAVTDCRGTDAFRADFASLLAAEEARAAVGQPNQVALSLADPEPLARWLEADGQNLEDSFASRPEACGRLLSASGQDDLLDRYERVLQQTKAYQQVCRPALPHMPPLEQLYDGVPDALAAQVERECLEALNVWLDSAVNRVLLESLVELPRDVKVTAHLRNGLQRLADAERNRLAVAERCPKHVTLTDAAAARNWLSQDGTLLSDASKAAAGLLAVAYPLYDRPDAGMSRAELLFSDLQRLRKELRDVGASRLKKPLLDKLIATAPARLEELGAAIAALRRKGFLGLLSPRIWRSRKTLAQWWTQAGISGKPGPLDELAQHATAAGAIQSVQRRADELLVSAGLPPLPPAWRNLYAHLGRLLKLLPEAHKLLSAVRRCPATIDQPRLMQQATPETLQRLVGVIGDSVALHEAKQVSLAALQAVTPFMAPSWLSLRRASIDANRHSPDQDQSLRQLVEAIAQLDSLQAFRDRIAGYHPLTLRALGALTAARDQLRGLARQDRGPVVKAALRYHRLLAHMRRLEAGYPALLSPGTSPAERIDDLLAEVSATRAVRERLNRCPAPEPLEQALRSGITARVFQLLNDYRLAVVQARAAKVSERALDACEKWFEPAWVERMRRGVREGTPATAELKRLESALPKFAAFQLVRTKLSHAHPAVASALPILGDALRSRGTHINDVAITIPALMRAAWCAAQRGLLAAHNSLLQTLGECRSRAEQEEALNTLLGERDISQAVLACPVPGDLHASLAKGSRQQLLEALQDLESAVNYARAAQASLKAITACSRWFDAEAIRRFKEACSQGISTTGTLRAIAAALPTLRAYTAMKAAFAAQDGKLLRESFQLLAENREAVLELPRETLAENILRLFRGTWLEQQKRQIEDREPGLDRLASITAEQYGTAAETLRSVRELTNCMAACPERDVVLEAISSGAPARVSQVLAGLEAGLAIHHARQASLAALERLEPWFTDEWITACQTAIYKGEPADALLGPVLAASSTISPYLQFRELLASFDPLVEPAFACLAKVRPELEATPANDLSLAIQRAVHHAALKGGMLAVEQEHPILRSLDSRSEHAGMATLAMLSKARQLQASVQACPLAGQLAGALSSLRADQVKQLLLDFAAAAEYARAVRGSVNTIQNLAGFMRPDWIGTATQAVLRGDETQTLRDTLSKAFPTLRAYQLFRGRAATLPETAIRCLEVLSKYRNLIREAANGTSKQTVGELVRRVIRREALLGWKNRLENDYPDVLADGDELRTQIARLHNLDTELRDLNRYRLSQNLPVDSIEGRAEWTNITRLSGPRAIRLREFFQRGTDLGLLSLRPVWLTTPDVASQLLPLERALFDLVIFDEASQMPVEYAVPCLYRARAAVVSGDDKQMPPSSFFASRIETNEPEAFDGDMPDEAATDQEREAFEQAWNRREIKDCPDLLHLGDAVLGRATLQVHYRSEYRELIAYSNAAFYQNELGVPVRHPDDAVRNARPIEYVNVSGIYANQTNEDEAEKVVELLAELWNSDEHAPPSVGVVTFNLRQADLIEELLEKRAEDDEDFRSAYAREQSRFDRGEDMSMFVKNVENVQGDERDLIIFSTTFGRTESGLFRRNFGVLGQKGGERRLNVAVTRARRKVVIVSSMPVDEVSDMLRSRRKPETPRDYLQAYLHYARLTSEGSLEEARKLAGRLSAAGRPDEATSSSGDGFLESVAAFIRSLGYEPVSTASDPILGVDFSIADPATGLFGVGIECNPPRHRLTQRARAREIWRPSVLERAYRVVHRVSPYAWYHDRDTERRRLRDVILKTLGRPSQPDQNKD